MRESNSLRQAQRGEPETPAPLFQHMDADMTWLGLDIGGANLKAADASGFATARPFAIWRAPEKLTSELQSLLANAPPHRRLAVTMTAELADCFETKAAGVRAIVDAVVAAADGRVVSVYATTGEFLAPHEAQNRPLEVAASNWHALAAFAARFCRSSGLVIDIGSTTSDLIPIVVGRPQAIGMTDPDRLLSGELVYAGVERTPVAAILTHLPWRGVTCPVAAELFATSLDAYLVLGEIPEEPDNHDTADGRPRTHSEAHARLARMVCADATMFSPTDALTAAGAIRAAQAAQLADALARVAARFSTPPESIILSGHGEFLARRLVEEFPWSGGPPRVVSLNKELGPALNRCAPAYAIAVLAEERQATGNAPHTAHAAEAN
jgi:probable H4MPT-linked C1 transfer pathway protein